MATLISDSDTAWREYERTERFLIFIWRFIYGSKQRSSVSAPRAPEHFQKREANRSGSVRFGDFIFRRGVFDQHVLEVKEF
jgi:hypothetical protein